MAGNCRSPFEKVIGHSNRWSWKFCRSLVLTACAALAPFFRLRTQSDAAPHDAVAALVDMSWLEFEMMVGEYFCRNGFTVTPTGSNDFIDLRLTRNDETYLVQCKHWRDCNVGVQPVREFYDMVAATGATGGYFVTSGEYTEEALEFVHGLNMRLIDGRKLLRMISGLRAEMQGESVTVS